MVDLGAVDARSKAAAWAWYQHTTGLTATARSEVALAPARPHHSIRGCPSRFKLEADLLRSGAPVLDTSDRLEHLHLPTDSSNSHSDGSMGKISISTVPSIMTSVQDTDRHAQGVCTDLVVAASSSYGAAAWDCGSALFDSFELVAMAKKLDDAHQLNHATMEKVCLPDETGAGADAQVGALLLDTDEVEEEEEKPVGDSKLAALDAAALTNALSSPSSLMCIRDPHGLSIDLNPVQLSPDQMQYRQAVYDMFCRYDNPEPQEGVLSQDVDLSIGEKMKKLKLTMPPVTRSSKQHRRRRLHNLSRAFRRHIAHLAGHVTQASSTAHRPPDKLHLGQSISAQADSPAQLQHQAHFLPAESTTYPRSPSHKTVHAVSPRVGSGIKSMGSPFREYPSPHKSAIPQARIKMAGSPFQESPPLETCGGTVPSHTRLRKQYSNDSVHHHYHHHYHHHHHHYLFRRHSDEGFTALPEPLLGADKSLLVAAAGLRMAKISSLQDYLSLNPKLEGSLLDCKRNVKDANMTTASLIQLPSPPSLHV